jgi:putative oxygen-independent coproporphyrinogen III oxidase
MTAPPSCSPETGLATPPIGLYLHLPWCIRKCPYCDFNSHASDRHTPFASYAAALIADLELELRRLGTRRISSIFVGGGTPSLFPPAAVAAVLATALPHTTPDVEVTLEANPGAADQARFEAYRSAGVNRLSIGVQSFDDDSLHRLGRVHAAADARAALTAARAAGFSRINLDIMFGLPGQTLAMAIGDIETAIDCSPEHISWYELTLEPNTVFHHRPPPLPDEDAVWAIQTAGSARLTAAGYRQYEVSAWAQPDEACRHNLNYWRYGDYLAAGAGAHGKLTDAAADRIIRYRKAKVPEVYMRRAQAGCATVETTPVDTLDRRFEFLLNRLRLREHFDLATFTAATGLPNHSLQPALSEWLRRGWLERGADGGYRASPQGWLHLDTLLQTCLPGEALP